MGALVPLITAALPYIAPPIGVAIGWVVGWFHHKHVAAKSANPTK